jgi:hypothetical protein
MPLPRAIDRAPNNINLAQESSENPKMRIAVPAKPDAPAFIDRLFAAGFLRAFAPASGRHDLHVIDPLHYGKAPQRRRNSD